jgi:hypothetical protein
MQCTLKFIIPQVLRITLNTNWLSILLQLQKAINCSSPKEWIIHLEQNMTPQNFWQILHLGESGGGLKPQPVMTHESKQYGPEQRQQHHSQNKAAVKKWKQHN